MPRKEMTQKTGSAPIVRQGHTTNGNYGSNPNAKGRGQNKPRDLKVK